MHRVRFFDYMPSAIRVMAFNSRTERLALARADGSVEIFNFSDNYFQEKVTARIKSEQPSLMVDLCLVSSKINQLLDLAHRPAIYALMPRLFGPLAHF